MLKAHENSAVDTAALMAKIGRKARAASRPLAVANTAAKNAALAAMADAIERNEKAILKANAIDVANGEEAKTSPPPHSGGGNLRSSSVNVSGRAAGPFRHGVRPTS
jgi:hypothetical protein